jgi:pimeloyl-ACP methyl ester carboxylesterase
LTKEVRRYFEAPQQKQVSWHFAAALSGSIEKDEACVREAVWQAYRTAAIHAAAKKDFGNNLVRYQKHVSAYTVKKVGKRPARGWPLFIAMHGGGGVPKAINDSQWKVMQIYYHDQPSVTGYPYLALRAPNDTWNGFYSDYVPPLVVNLVRQFLLLGDVDPDKVFLMGYSHGGYGAFSIGPRIADRFAAVHASAAAPSDGHHIARNLRSLPFSFMIGEKDTAYGRIERCKAFAAAARKLRAEHDSNYPIRMELIKGMGHGGLPDRDKIKDLYPRRRDAVPRRVTWELSDDIHTRFYWLGVPRPGRGQAIDAALAGNKVTATTRNVAKLELCLDTRLVDFSRPLAVTCNGKASEVKIAPSLATLCRTMAEHGDPYLASTCVVLVVPARK